VRPRIERTRRGDYRLRLPAEEREVLRTLPGQLRELLETDDPSLVRLHPPAYADETEAAEFERLVGGDLLAGRRETLRILEETVDNDRLTEEQLDAWLRALNDLRLVLGTRLAVTEESYGEPVDPRDPLAPERALFGYLSWLQEEAVAAIASGYPR
jgi:Domain of unknown function (DUF2017)